ncbi:hypothetical protein ACO1NF_14070, partial [Staphylococcus aureus]
MGIFISPESHTASNDIEAPSLNPLMKMRLAMRLSVVSLLMILTTVFLSACGRDEVAPLVDNSHNF